MRYISLGSGSRGNATLIDSGLSCVLIDCGFSRKVLYERLEKVGVDQSRLTAVFATHEHADHAKGVLSVCEHLNIPLYASFGTAKKMQWIEHSLWQCIRGDEAVSLADLRVHPVVVPHDALEPVQFVVQHMKGHKLGILSDLGSLTPHLVAAYQGCHALQLEANHDLNLLQAGPYPPSLKRRVSGNYGHLSNEQCVEFLKRVYCQV